MSENPDLFPVGETLSPRARWMRDHGIVFIYADEHADESKVSAYRGNIFRAIGTPDFATADDEDAALFKLAAQCGLELWHRDANYSRQIFTGAVFPPVTLTFAERQSLRHWHKVLNFKGGRNIIRRGHGKRSKFRHA